MAEEAKKKEKSKIMAWIKAKADGLRSWYYKDENALRIVHFPSTKLPLLDVIIVFFKNFIKGRTPDRAAGVAFNFFLALFPLVLFFFTLIPYIPISNLYDRVLMFLESLFLPSGTLTFVTDTIDDIMNQPHEGLLSLSIVLSLLFGSSGVVAFFRGFRNVYADFIVSKKLTLKDWLLQRVFAVAMLLILGVLMVVSIVFISSGGSVLELLVEQEILRSGFVILLFNFLRWLITIFFLCLTVATLYYFGNVKFDEHYRKERKYVAPGQKKFREFVLFSPGSILATALFIVATFGFNVYIRNFSRYNALYGSIGTLIVLMLWGWIIAIVVLAGNDLNSGIRREIDRLSANEDCDREKQIVVEDLKRHIQTKMRENESRDKKIASLQSQMQEKQKLIERLTEENRDASLIIKTYNAFVKQELSATPASDDDKRFDNTNS